MNTVKNVKTRDAATSILRKMGIAKSDYDLFITKRASENTPNSNYFAVDIHLAAEHLKPKTENPKKTSQNSTEKRVSCASVAREMILSGKTNAEVWPVIKAQFNLDDSKKHYPAWYRCELRRAGKVH